MNDVFFICVIIFDKCLSGPYYRSSTVLGDKISAVNKTDTEDLKPTELVSTLPCPQYVSLKQTNTGHCIKHGQFNHLLGGSTPVPCSGTPESWQPAVVFPAPAQVTNSPSPQGYILESCGKGQRQNSEHCYRYSPEDYSTPPKWDFTFFSLVRKVVSLKVLQNSTSQICIITYAIFTS